MTPPRSYLFVPGNRPERFGKARLAGADAVILDLEDAVPPAEKEQARASILRALDVASPVHVRINGADTEWFDGDVAALANHLGVAGLILPKAEERGQVDAIRQRGRVGLTISPLIETARGFSRLDKLCRAEAVDRVIFGTLDFQLDLGMVANDEELIVFRSGIVLASRLAGIAAPVDGVSIVIDDPQIVEADARRGRRLGFGAKLCIHPKQIDAVHRAYVWNDAEREWAKRVLKSVAQSGGAAVAVDGEMVDAPVILKARRIVASE